ncbi:glycosyltransferase [Nonomuraea sp. NPDC050663]|uniref:glycosyltransferase n=1 Tax=Nonomuraea sp. NPDC050663 TaxID=3364370 RepID=UPI0037925D9D
MKALTLAQAAAAAAVAARLARGRHRPPPLRPVTDTRGVSVVIPARDEEARLAPCLQGVLADPAAAEVIVVDDSSTDGTAQLAARLGARVVPAGPLPPGWVGKQWALRQGVSAAAHPVVVTLDADTRPAPGLVGAMAAALSDHDLVTAAPRFDCGSPAEQALHASMLATLVYRFGPSSTRTVPPPHRTIANGQCTAFRRDRMLAADGFAAVKASMTDDVALARHLAATGWRVAFLDASDLLAVDMHDSVTEVWREWGRSLPLADVTSPGWQTADLAVVWLTMGLPSLRLLLGRPTPFDLALLVPRWLLTAAFRRSYASPGPGLALSPLLDVASAVRLTQATVRPARTWRGRTYPGSGLSPARRERPARSATRSGT